MHKPIFNKLSIEGTADKIAEIKDRLGRGRLVAHKVSLTDPYSACEYRLEPDTAFMLANIVRPDKEERTKHEKLWLNAQHWGTATWGVQEEVTNAQLVSDFRTALDYRFETIGFAPHRAIKMLSKMYDAVDFTLDVTHASGAGASHLYQEGATRKSAAWARPDSHKAFEKIRGKNTCSCGSTMWLQVFPPFVDCVRRPVPTDRAVDEMDLALSNK